MLEGSVAFESCTVPFFNAGYNTMPITVFQETYSVPKLITTVAGFWSKSEIFGSGQMSLLNTLRNVRSVIFSVGELKDQSQSLPLAERQNLIKTGLMTF